MLRDLRPRCPPFSGRTAGVRGYPDGMAFRACYAAWLGGLWLCRVRWPSGLVAVVVPSLWRVRFQPHRWMAVRWWKVHSGTRLGRLVGPLRARGMRWWMSQTLAGWSQPGNAQWGWRVVAARRRWAGMVSVAAPMSSGRLTEVSGRPSRAARSRAASPSGPDRASAARPSSARRSRSRVAGLSGPGRGLAADRSPAGWARRAAAPVGWPVRAGWARRAAAPVGWPVRAGWARPAAAPGRLAGLARTGIGGAGGAGRAGAGGPGRCGGRGRRRAGTRRRAGPGRPSPRGR